MLILWGSGNLHSRAMHRTVGVVGIPWRRKLFEGIRITSPAMHVVAEVSEAPTSKAKQVRPLPAKS